VSHQKNPELETAKHTNYTKCFLNRVSLVAKGTFVSFEYFVVHLIRARPCPSVAKYASNPSHRRPSREPFQRFNDFNPSTRRAAHSHTYIICMFSKLPFSNCLRQNARKQFDSFVNGVNITCYAKTGESNRREFSRLMGGQIPAKTARQNIKNKGLFASLRPIRPICPFGASQTDTGRTIASTNSRIFQ
jgi:hypothetical protein